MRSKPWLRDSGPRLVRRLSRIPGALARRELHMPGLEKPDRYKLILVFFEKKGYKKDALDRRLFANRRYEAIARRPGLTLQDFLATENMAYAGAVKAGVGIDPDRRAYHMFIKSGLTGDQINHIYGFVYDSEAEGPGVAADPRKIQETELRFYGKPWGRGSTPRLPSIHGPVLKTSDKACGNDALSSDVVSSPVQGWQQGQLHARALVRRKLS